MLQVAVFGVLSGLDNLQVSAALGLARVRPRRRLALAGAFAACEALMPLLGLACGGALRRAVPGLEAVGPVALLLCGAAILLRALRDGDAARVVEGRWMLGLPLTLSLDNLFAGVGLGSAGYPVLASALVVGAISASMCVAGIFAGGWLRRFVPSRPEVWSGAFLVALALISLAGRGA
ncbi:MAG TPA: manganese efflux pump [Longimicrobium sp.]|jgi:putative Mn2+ efflux pump MntP